MLELTAAQTNSVYHKCRLRHELGALSCSQQLVDERRQQYYLPECLAILMTYVLNSFYLMQLQIDYSLQSCIVLTPN